MRYHHNMQLFCRLCALVSWLVSRTPMLEWVIKGRVERAR